MSLLDGLRKIDPFYYFDRVKEKHLKDFPKLAVWIIELAYTLLAAFFILGVFSVALFTKRPVVVVASESMKPVLEAGDIAIVTGWIPPQAPEVQLDLNLSGKKLIDIAKIQDNELIFLDGTRAKIGKGSIIVYKHPLGPDIIHRAVLKIKARDGVYYLTKGDNSLTNPFLDQDCSRGVCLNPFPVPESKVYGVVIFRIPLLGLPKVWLDRAIVRRV